MYVYVYVYVYIYTFIYSYIHIYIYPYIHIYIYTYIHIYIYIYIYIYKYIFSIFDKVNPNINSILAFLNNIHCNIKFTVEHETNHCLHFLDIDIKFSNSVFTTCTYN